ncbi:unnamed protein product, partial [marine sediment metagenome]
KMDGKPEEVEKGFDSICRYLDKNGFPEFIK